MRTAYLIAFDGLEESAKVAGSEALISLALNDLEEEGAGLGAVVVLRRLLEKDLQQVAVARAAVDQDAEVTEHVGALVDGADTQPRQAFAQHVVVGAWRGHERDAALAKPAHAPHD